MNLKILYRALGFAITITAITADKENDCNCASLKQMVKKLSDCCKNKEVSGNQDDDYDDYGDYGDLNDSSTVNPTAPAIATVPPLNAYTEISYGPAETIYEGESQTWICSVKSPDIDTPQLMDHVDNIYWSYAPGIKTDNNSEAHVDQLPGEKFSRLLIIKKVQQSDAARYTCNVQMKDSKDPLFTITSARIEHPLLLGRGIFVGESVELPCDFDIRGRNMSDVKDVRWFRTAPKMERIHDNQPGDRHHIIYHTTNSKKSAILYLENAQISDSNMYVCVVKFGNQWIQRSKINVLVRPRNNQSGGPATADTLRIPEKNGETSLGAGWSSDQSPTSALIPTASSPVPVSHGVPATPGASRIPDPNESIAIIGRPKDRIYEGQFVNLTCDFDHNKIDIESVIEIKWVATKSVDKSDTTKAYVHPNEKKIPKILTISDARDAHNYICIIKTKYHDFTAIPDVPIEPAELIPLDRFQGDRLKLHCSFERHEYPSNIRNIFWVLKNNTGDFEIFDNHTSDRHHITKDYTRYKLVSTLTINNLQLSDTGEYQCLFMIDEEELRRKTVRLTVHPGNATTGERIGSVDGCRCPDSSAIAKSLDDCMYRIKMYGREEKRREGCRRYFCGDVCDCECESDYLYRECC